MRGMADATKSVTEAVVELIRRSGLTRSALAKLTGFAGGSSIQHYEDPTRFRKKYLPLDIAERFANAFDGLGEPQITCEEVMALAGRKSEDGKPSKRDQQANSELALNGSDHYMARVLEDVIKLLVIKGVLKINELPTAARDRLGRRRSLRNDDRLQGDD